MLLACAQFISYRRDAETCSVQELTQRVLRKTGSRVVPVISFVFGGGQSTIRTIVESMANNNPIIVTAGSGRCADLISDCKLIVLSNPPLLLYFWKVACDHRGGNPQADP